MKPCPFCGTNRIHVVSRSVRVANQVIPKRQPAYRVSCWGCGNQGREGPSEEAAIVEWNTRTPDPLAPLAQAVGSADMIQTALEQLAGDPSHEYGVFCSRVNGHQMGTLVRFKSRRYRGENVRICPECVALLMAGHVIPARGELVDNWAEKLAEEVSGDKLREAPP